MATTTSPFPPALRRLLVGVAVSALGNGLTLPFLVIYLHQVRGFPLATAGLVLSTVAVVGLVIAPAGGATVDRLGPVPVLVAASLLEGSGAALLPLVHQPWQAFPVAALLGCGGLFWSAFSSLIASLVPSDGLPRVFGIQFALLNAGIGVGGVAGGLVARVGHPDSFAVLYLADAATFFAYAAVLVTLRRAPLPHAGPRADAPGPSGPGGYRSVLSDRLFLRYLALSTLFITLGYAQMESGFPAFATGSAHVSTRTVGFAFAANTAVIVAGQLLVLRRMKRVRRTRALALTAVVWAFAWLLAGVAGAMPGQQARSVLAVSTLALFGLGETFFSPVGNSLVNDLAPAHLRGHYNALSSSTWALGNVVGPALAGVMLGAGLAGLWVFGLVVGLAGAAVAALTLERHLTPRQNGIRTTPVPAVEPDELVQPQPA